MADFIIIRDVWLHGRVYARGSEDKLAAAMTPEKRHEMIERGNLRPTNNIEPPSVADEPVFDDGWYPEEAGFDDDE